MAFKFPSNENAGNPSSVERDSVEIKPGLCLMRVCACKKVKLLGLSACCLMLSEGNKQVTLDEVCKFAAYQTQHC